MRLKQAYVLVCFMRRAVRVRTKLESTISSKLVNKLVKEKYFVCTCTVDDTESNRLMFVPMTGLGPTASKCFMIIILLQTFCVIRQTHICMTRVTDNSEVRWDGWCLPGRRWWMQRAVGCEWWRRQTRRAERTVVSLRCHGSECQLNGPATVTCRRHLWDHVTISVV